MEKIVPGRIKLDIIIYLRSLSNKIIKTLSLFILISGVAVAQTRIYGKVVGVDDKPLDNANVLLLNIKDSSLTKGQLTNAAGMYRFENIFSGNYYIIYSYSGYRGMSSHAFIISGKQENIDNGTIKLTELPVELKKVTVAAKKNLYEQKIDRLVINVASSITFSGSSALDVLERSPGIFVDRIHNSLSINGKSGVIVMMNNKRSYMELSAVIQMLAGIPSGNIERIEVITTPPANFDAEGNAGIINIVLKANPQFGTNGSYTVSAGYSKGEQSAFSLNINHRRGKVNLFGSYSFSHDHGQQVWTNYHAVNHAGNFMENYSESHRDFEVFQHDAQAGIDYEISKKTIIGGLVTGSDRIWNMKSNNTADVSVNHLLDTSVQVINHELHTSLNLGMNINLQHNFKPDEKMSVNADYLSYQDKDPNTYLNDYYDNAGAFLYNEHVRSSKITPLIFWILAMDYSKKVSKKLDMEAGIKGAVSKLNNDVQISTFLRSEWIKDSSLSGYHSLKESIGAAYCSFNVKVDSSTSVKLGLRYEFTRSNLGSPTEKSIVDRKYGNVFPSLFILHNINEKNAVNISYSKRIERPNFSALAPWVIFLDPKTFQTGNPAIQPAVTDAVSTSYTYINKIFSLGYSYTKAPISLQPKVDENTNILVSSLANAISNKNINISVTLPFTITKWWKTENNISGYWAQSKTFYKATVNTQNTSYYINSTQTFTLPKALSLQISGYYYTGGNWGLYYFKPMGSIDLGAQKKFVEKKSTLSFNIRSLVKTLASKSYAVIPQQNLMAKSRSIYGYTNYSLSFNRSFGSDKIKWKRDRSTGAEDEKGRAY